MELEKVEDALRKMVTSLDKGIRLETVDEEEDAYRLVLGKGNHSERGTIDRPLLEAYLAAGKNLPEIKKVLGKVISKLNRLAQRRY
jgi:hypothetical protein